MASGYSSEIKIADLRNKNTNKLIDSYKIKMTWSSVANIDANTSALTLTFLVYAPEWDDYYEAEAFWGTMPPLSVSFDGTNAFTHTFTSADEVLTYGGVWETLYTTTLTIPHNSDGSKTLNYTAVWQASVEDLGYCDTYNPDNERYSTAKITEDISFSGVIVLDNIPREAKILTASSFTDETNPNITYSNPAGNAATALEACISLTGGVDDIAYRAIPKTGTSYTFPLTEAEKNVLRAAAANTQTMTVRFYVRTTIGSTRYFSYLDRTFTVVNCNPVISNATVKDITPETIALTGDENIIVLNESMIEYSYTATAMKYATITSHYIECGDVKVEGLLQGVIDDAQSGLFTFGATDSRGLTSTFPVQKQVVNYVKPTCYQHLKAELAGETGATITLTIDGNYFNGSFGLAANELKLEVRHTQNDGTMGDWVDLTSGLIPTFNENTYSLTTTITGFSYSQSYTFQCRATDKLNVVQSAQYTVRVRPIFDWGEDDFNFNVPVNINAETLSMNGETIIRHSATTNNTVLSASGGHIYIRPGGTTDTSSEMRLTAQGDLELKGDIKINGVSLIAALEAAGIL